MVRTVDPAPLARAALGLPPGQRRPAEPEAPDHPLTVREQALFRAATRRALRAATGLAGITVAVVAPVNALGMTILFSEEQTQVLTINGILAVVGLGVAVLVLGRWRLPPLPLAVGLAFSASPRAIRWTGRRRTRYGPDWRAWEIGAWESDPSTRRPRTRWTTTPV